MVIVPVVLGILLVGVPFFIGFHFGREKQRQATMLKERVPFVLPALSDSSPPSSSPRSVVPPSSGPWHPADEEEDTLDAFPKASPQLLIEDRLSAREEGEGRSLVFLGGSGLRTYFKELGCTQAFDDLEPTRPAPSLDTGGFKRFPSGEVKALPKIRRRSGS